ncbi:ABC transporter ATP-binding protein [Variovorax sp. WS11]|uniref:ABC transporter ATP-binding protein n=1 Tax=Variovorax sp. WS11 TaxID=1105204 RepID=UPI000D0E0EBB|nr:ABC transporter ATP-binding protein [Variovorax sp. WS11]NDZ17654.1 ABC transporter ATP-binding protein [Variovorax sp. WS11]PSL79566.1 ABC transporter ATP-binding protein [Variovorax sp. WS11]
MLHVDALHTYYGDSHILHGVSLNVGAGECVALLGRNGAGKTTTLKTILGLATAARGKVSLKGVDITNEQTFQIIRHGIGYVPEHRGIFPTLTVGEHLRLAASSKVARIGRTKSQRVRTYVTDDVLKMFPRIAGKLDNFGSQLSGGEQQMLAIARALLANPALLVLDEPSEGLAPAIVDFLEERLLEIKRGGTPILVVEQNYYLATALADRVYLLSQGEVKFSGTTDQLAAADQIRATYLSV